MIRAIRFVTFLLMLWTMTAATQIVENLPGCWRACISQSGNLNCASSETECICHASDGNFLPNVITCARANCDTNAMDANILLTPLEAACSLLGVPIAPGAISAAEHAATVTNAIPAASGTIIVGTVASPSRASSHPACSEDSLTTPTTYVAVFASSATMTSTTTDSSGDIFVLLIPTITTVTSETMLHTTTTCSTSGSVSVSSGIASGSPATSTRTLPSQVSETGGGATSTQRSTPGSSRPTNTYALTAQETNGAPLDYYQSDAAGKRMATSLVIGVTAVLVAWVL